MPPSSTPCPRSVVKSASVPVGRGLRFDGMKHPTSTCTLAVPPLCPTSQRASRNSCHFTKRLPAIHWLLVLPTHDSLLPSCSPSRATKELSSPCLTSIGHPSLSSHPPSPTSVCAYISCQTLPQADRLRALRLPRPLPPTKLESHLLERPPFGSVPQRSNLRICPATCS